MVGQTFWDVLNAFGGVAFVATLIWIWFQERGRKP